MASDPLCVLTWNVQGSRGLDTAAVAATIGAAEADVVVLQEIQRRQADRLADALGVSGQRWAFKHWAIPRRAEGVGVLTRHRLVSAQRFVLRRAPFWSWRRRVALEATIERDGEPFVVIDAHLSPKDDSVRRRHEAELVVARAARASPVAVIAGDLNDAPGGLGYAALTTAGWVDAWRAVHGDDERAGATNWTGGPRRGRVPTQRLDYVLAPPGWLVDSCVVAVNGSLDAAADLSDHLPVAATLRPPASRS
jgi:endonuclease/exonuclease/phosphatase family metal-dependent hydrolase